ncbi:MAG: hypothetical protein RL481_394 [Pseudomonadota bacterium]
MRRTKGRSAFLRLASIGWPADQHKTAVAIAALDSAAFINFQPDPGMAKRRRQVCAAAIARDTAGSDKQGFGCLDHGFTVSKARPRTQRPRLEIVQRNGPCARIGPGRLVRPDIERSAHWKVEDTGRGIDSETQRCGRQIGGRRATNNKTVHAHWRTRPGYKNLVGAQRDINALIVRSHASECGGLKAAAGQNDTTGFGTGTIGCNRHGSGRCGTDDPTKIQIFNADEFQRADDGDLGIGLFLIGIGGAAGSEKRASGCSGP